jgi:hypothetical protein
MADWNYVPRIVPLPLSSIRRSAGGMRRASKIQKILGWRFASHLEYGNAVLSSEVDQSVPALSQLWSSDHGAQMDHCWSERQVNRPTPGPLRAGGRDIITSHRGRRSTVTFRSSNGLFATRQPPAPGWRISHCAPEDGVAHQRSRFPRTAGGKARRTAGRPRQRKSGPAS